ncbi:hypothetical protein HYFRA_00003594 [Hymenoscyphus fraxineus]|uniref:Uncharacterized protein n=1 Tax=Hymenoscyphus fraxineus TaxID=746836 RepID=A0A9N9KZ99_9HELO|nr:hypothetical protein HYFRA_00003594 [Hymenoscyphus fraxineus]
MLIPQIFTIGAILLHSVVAIPLAATKDATPEVQLSRRSTHRLDWPKAPHRRSVNSHQHERRVWNSVTPTKQAFRKVFGKGKESKTKPKPKPPQAAAPIPITELQKPNRPLRTSSSKSIKRGLPKDSSRTEVTQHERRLVNPFAGFRKVFGKGKKTQPKPQPAAPAPIPIAEWQKPYRPPPTYNYHEPLPVPKPMPPSTAGANTPFKPPPTYSYNNIKRQLRRRSSRSKVARRSEKSHLL